MRQAALLLYAQDYDGQFSHCDFFYGNSVVNAWDWGKWYWMFTCRPYLGTRTPADWTQGKPGQSIFCCPAKPVLQKLIKSGQINSLYKGGLAKIWNLTYSTLPRTTTKGYATWCSYAINEHIPYASWRLSDWQRPTKSYLLLESNDTEMTGNQLSWKFNYDMHGEGSNILFMDGHIKWVKSEYNGIPTNVNTVWKTPPGGPGGGLGDPATDLGKDTGPWTASMADDQ